VIQTLTLFLGSLPPQVGCGYLSGQAQNLLLSYILSLSRSHKLVSQNGDPLGCSGHLIMGGCEQLSFLSGDPLRLDSRALTSMTVACARVTSSQSSATTPAS
jgi:hypothetical protein